MKRRIYNYIFFTLLLSIESIAQQFTVDIGRNTTSFDYTNSEGESTLDLFSENNFTYSVGYRKELNRLFHYHASLLLNKYSAFGSDQFNVNELRWESSYTGIQIGMDAEVFKKKGFSFFLRAAGGPQFFVKGTQSINNESFSLKKVEQFDKPRLFVSPAIGFNYCSDSRVGVSLKYSYSKGFPLGTTDNEKLIINSSAFTIGLLWSLGDCDYCYIRNNR
ncbi:MAG: hypothetical protein AAF487_13860 [Bacteroidota bacterium]